MKIYIIQSALIWKENETKFEFENLWAVESEEAAKKDCIKMQLESNSNYLGYNYKMIYKYEKIVLYKEL